MFDKNFWTVEKTEDSVNISGVSRQVSFIRGVYAKYFRETAERQAIDSGKQKAAAGKNPRQPESRSVISENLFKSNQLHLDDTPFNN